MTAVQLVSTVHWCYNHTRVINTRYPCGQVVGTGFREFAEMSNDEDLRVIASNENRY